MTPGRRSIHRSQPVDKPTDQEPSIYGLDKQYRCPACDFVALFSEMISGDKYHELLRAWDGHRIEDYYLATQRQDDAVEERLRALGYVD